MTPLEELTQLASEKGRRIFVAQSPINLRAKEGENCVYVLQLPESPRGSAGGRIGGFGERRIRKILCFRLENGTWIKGYETDSEEKLEQFELPYHAAGLTITLPDGSERAVTGVVDEEFIQRYSETL